MDLDALLDVIVVSPEFCDDLAPVETILRSLELICVFAGMLLLTDVPGTVCDCKTALPELEPTPEDGLSVSVDVDNVRRVEEPPMGTIVSVPKDDVK